MTEIIHVPISTPCVSQPYALSQIRPRISRFSPIARELRDCQSRIILSAESQAHFDSLRSEFEKSGAGVLSIDVFDTLLLRNNQSEARRFLNVSHRILRELQSSGKFGKAHSLTQYDLMIARADAMRVSYRTRRPVRGCVEGAITDVIKIARRSLGLPPEADAIFRQCEIEYEASVLHFNKALFKLIPIVRSRGGQIILVSDMYLSSDLIGSIIQKIEPAALDMFDAIFSSGDLLVSKRSGRIFGEIERQLETGSASFFHIGDSFLGDVAKPREAGWKAIHYPVSEAEMHERAGDLASFVSEMRALGLAVDHWAKI